MAKFCSNCGKELNENQDFIQQNYTPYSGDDSFLETTTKKTRTVWDTCQKLLKKELKKHGMRSLNASFSQVGIFHCG